MESTIYNSQGKKSGTVKLPENVFNVAWSDALIHQVVTAMQANARPTVAHAKTRGEVRGGGKKPWAQKGTGRARHGSSRSPIWKGGGVTHGPRSDRDYSQVIPKKMRAKALFMALSRKLKDGEILFVDSFGISEPKTAAAQKALAMLSKVSGFGKLGTKRKNAALIAFADPTAATQKSFRNIGNVTAVAVRNLNPVAVLGNTYLILENPEAAIAIVASRSGKKIVEAQK
ncbi:50S ribosomal protein L4 [Candidatus Kaiserbacteria bacterium]|nr:50S ribosomal protein L4 [Candidatus Kaiserbacteria bacterium]